MLTKGPFFFVQKSHDQTESSRRPAEIVWVETQRCRLTYRLEADAMAAASAMVPEGKDPFVYAGLRVLTTGAGEYDIVKERDGSYSLCEPTIAGWELVPIAIDPSDIDRS